MTWLNLLKLGGGTRVGAYRHFLFELTDQERDDTRDQVGITTLLIWALSETRSLSVEEINRRVLG
tara:strand:- start:383 stop:577 length:195 start_codon:yes stop_codon:yes gene_type:complete